MKKIIPFLSILLFSVGSLKSQCIPNVAPWFDDVEAHTPTSTLGTSLCWIDSSFAPFSWDISGTGTTASFGTGPATAFSGTNFFFTEASMGNTGDVALLVSPVIDISPLTTPTLEFYYHMFGNDIGELYVDLFDGNSWVEMDSLNGPQQLNQTDPWLKRTLGLSSFSGTIQLRFRAIRGVGFTGDIAIDNINVIGGITVTCPAPSNLNTTNVTSNSADLTWIENGSATTWDVEWGPNGFTQGTGVLISSTTVNPLNITGLVPGVSYCYYVRTICLTGDTSNWAGPSCFTTPIPCNLSASYSALDNGNGNYTFTNSSTGNFTQSYWSFGDGNSSLATSPNHTFSANGTYVAVLGISDTNSCIDYALDTITVTGVSNPTACNAGFSVYPDANNVFVVNSSTGSNLTYLWDFGDGNTSTQAFPNHTYSTAGPFILCLTIDDGNGCVDTYCDTINASGIFFKQTGFNINIIAAPLVTSLGNELESTFGITIYPNPASNQLNIVNNNLTLTQINIIDITGKILKQINQNINKIDVSDLPAGVYFIKVIGKEKTIVEKVIIE